MEIPNYIATPQEPHEEFIDCSGDGDTIEEAVSGLKKKTADLRFWAEWNEAIGLDIPIKVFKACSPEDGGWHDNPNEYQWCITGDAVHTESVACPPPPKFAKETKDE